MQKWHVLMYLLEGAAVKMVQIGNPKRGSKAGSGGVKTCKKSKTFFRNVWFSECKETIRGPNLQKMTKIDLA